MDTDAVPPVDVTPLGFLTEPLLVALFVVGVAALVNLLAPGRRRGLRSSLRMFALYVGAHVIEGLLALAGVEQGMRWVGVTADLLLAFTLVDLVALLALDLIAPRIGLAVASIVADIGIGLSYFVVGAIVLSAAGIDPTSVVAASTIVAAVLTVSLQGTLGNVIGGFVLQLDGSVHAGDWLKLDNGLEGFVRTVRWRHTLLETRDGDTVVVPNANLLQSQFLVLGKREGQPMMRREWSHFQVDFRFAPSHVVRVVEDALRSSPIAGVAADPPPDVVVLDLAKEGRETSYAGYAVRHWIVELGPDEPINSRVRQRIYTALRRARIPLAQPSAMVFHTERAADHLARDLEGKRQRGLDAMARIELFKSLTQGERDHLAAHLVPAPFTVGEVMARQGEVAHFLYLLSSGTAEVRVMIDAGERVVAKIEAPSFFGEMGMLTGEPRQANVIAVTDCECYQLDRTGLEEILVARPDIAAELSTLLAARRVGLRAAQEGLDDASRKAAEAHLRAQLVFRIRSFFGLDEGS